MRLVLGITYFENRVVLIKSSFLVSELRTNSHQNQYLKEAKQRSMKISLYMRQRFDSSLCHPDLAQIYHRKEVKTLSDRKSNNVKLDRFLNSPITGGGYEHEPCRFPSGEAIVENKLNLEPNQETRELHPASQIIRAVKTSQVHKSSDSIEVSHLAKFGVYISAIRRKKKLSLHEFAELASIQDNLALQIELGLATLDQVIDNLGHMSTALGKDHKKLSDLLATILIEDC